MALLLMAGLLGLFFHGPLSNAVARSDDASLAVQYERFAHKTALTHFVIRVDAPIPDQTLVRIGPAFADTHDIDSVEPRPVPACVDKQMICLGADQLALVCDGRALAGLEEVDSNNRHVRF